MCQYLLACGTYQLHLTNPWLILGKIAKPRNQQTGCHDIGKNQDQSWTLKMECNIYSICNKNVHYSDKVRIMLPAIQRKKNESLKIDLWKANDAHLENEMFYYIWRDIIRHCSLTPNLNGLSADNFRTDQELNRHLINTPLPIQSWGILAG